MVLGAPGPRSKRVSEGEACAQPSLSVAHSYLSSSSIPTFQRVSCAQRCTSAIGMHYPCAKFAHGHWPPGNVAGSAPAVDDPEFVLSSPMDRPSPSLVPLAESLRPLKLTETSDALVQWRRRIAEG